MPTSAALFWQKLIFHNAPVACFKEHIRECVDGCVAAAIIPALKQDIIELKHSHGVEENIFLLGWRGDIINKLTPSFGLYSRTC